VEAAPELGITVLTLYAFSADNWRRPEREVGHLMRLFLSHLDSERARLRERGVRLSVIGRRDRIPLPLREKIADVEEGTKDGTSLHLRIAIDYSGRDSLLAAASRLPQGTIPTREAFEKLLWESIHAPGNAGDVDLLIRTGGEQRLSDFLLWESAYAELYFTDILWPDFTGVDLRSAVRWFSGRERRFGGLPPEAMGKGRRTLGARRAVP
jgi:undecaprenyl diphosphate synthase